MIVGTYHKQPEESDVVGINFDRWLSAGESITNATATARNARTGDDATPIVLSGAPTITGTQALVRVFGGVSRTNYIVQLTISTSLAKTRQAEFQLAVKED